MLKCWVCLQIIFYFLTSLCEELILHLHLLKILFYPFECEQTNTSPKKNKLVVDCPRLVLLANLVLFIFGLLAFLLSF